jgi:hypothetical protein
VTKIYSPNREYNGNSAGVQFQDGVGTADKDAPLWWFHANGYGVGKRPDEPDAAETTDARDVATRQVVGTELRDAAVEPRDTDFLAPTNAGQADPHGPEVVAPSIHATEPTPIVPGPVGTDEGAAAANPSNPTQLTPEQAAELSAQDAAAQDEQQTAQAQATLVDQEPATVGQAFDPNMDTGNMGPLGLSDPASVEAGVQAAAAVAGESPSRGASQASWVDYAVARGADRDAVADMTRAQLIEAYGPKE